MNKENKSKMSDFNDENGNFDCVIFKHKLQERLLRKETKNMNVDEYVEYINKI
ncbi:MAG: hypothetical protein LBM96_11630 [Methanobrevibacter sp.]|jgi:hypothetical protein|nr:hypothetical protein [Candidatus Methanoflexus mossambicus]